MPHRSLLPIVRAVALCTFLGQEINEVNAIYKTPHYETISIDIRGGVLRRSPDLMASALKERVRWIRHLTATIFHFNNSLYVLQYEVSKSIKCNGQILPGMWKQATHSSEVAWHSQGFTLRLSPG